MYADVYSVLWPAISEHRRRNVDALGLVSLTSEAPWPGQLSTKYDHRLCGQIRTSDDGMLHSCFNKRPKKWLTIPV